MKFALVLIAALALSSAYVVEDTPAMEFPALVESNKRLEFDQVIDLMQAATSVADTNPIDEFLNKYKEQLQKEAAEHKALHEKNVKECDDEEDFRRKEIDEAITSAANAKVHKELCYAEFTEATQLEVEAQQATVIYSNHLSSLENLRKEQIATYNARSTDLKAALAGITGCYSFLDELEASVAKPTKTALVHLNSMMQVAVAHNLYEHMIPVYQNFMEVEGAFSQDDITAVRNSLKNFEDNVNKAQKELDDQEEKDFKFYTLEKARLTAILARLANQEVRAAKYKEEMDACYKQEKEIEKLAIQKKQHNSEALAHAIAMCDADAKAYAAAVANTARELKLLAQLRRAILQLAKSYLTRVLPKVDNLIKVKKTKGDTMDRREQMKVCQTLKLHHINDPDCDNLAYDITTL